MTFVIQVSNPRVVPVGATQAADLSEAIDLLFLGETEDSIVLWNLIPVRINYKYDLSVMIDDLAPLLEALCMRDAGSLPVAFGSNSFNAEWNVRWNGGHVRIQADWHSVAGRYEDVLNSRQNLECGQTEFLQEWKMLLKKVIEVVERSGIDLADRHRFEQIRSIEARIVYPGILYLPVDAARQ